MTSANLAPTDLVRSYYQALDDHDYETLASLLAPGFVHDRPDRTFEGSARFVAFMRDERPLTDTTHAIEEVYTNQDESELVVRGRLRDADGEDLFTFLDVHTLTDSGEKIERLQTFVRSE